MIYNAQHPHHPRLPHSLNQAASDRTTLYGSPSTNDFATYQNYASTASTVSTLAQFNYNNPESYPYTPTTPPTTGTDLSATTPSRLELSASALAAASSPSSSGGHNRLARGHTNEGGPRHSVKDGQDEEGEPFASIRIQVSQVTEIVPIRNPSWSIQDFVPLPCRPGRSTWL